MNIPTWVAFTISLGGLDPGLLFIITFRIPMYSKILIVGRDRSRGRKEGEQRILGTKEGGRYLNVLLLFPES